MYHLALDPNDPESMVHVRAGRDGRTATGEQIRFDLAASAVRFFDPSSEAALPAPVATTPTIPALAAASSSTTSR
jgi:hypothetical protein